MIQAQLHYNRVARVLHWTIGTLIVLNIVGGIVHEPLGKIFPVMPLHKSVGFVVLFLSLFRLAWRLTHPAPPLPGTMPRWEKAAAHGLHWIFYALMIVMPMTGWAFSSAGDRPLQFFGLFDIPKLAVAKGSGLAQGTHNAHVLFGYLWAVLLVGHVGAALRHQYLLKDGVMNRMWRSAPEG